MELFNSDSHYDFMAKRRLALIFSLTLIAISIVSLGARWLNLGIDFTGGTLVEVGYDGAPLCFERLAAAGFEVDVNWYVRNVDSARLALDPDEEIRLS